MKDKRNQLVIVVSFVEELAWLLVFGHLHEGHHHWNRFDLLKEVWPPIVVVVVLLLLLQQIQSQ